MRVLLMTSINERQVFEDVKILKALIEQDKAINIFSVNMFADYLMQTKKADYVTAIFSALDVVSFIEGDCIVIGNAPKTVDFTDVFCLEEYEDSFLQQMQGEFAKNDIDDKYLQLYKPEDATKVQFDDKLVQFLLRLVNINGRH